MSLLDPTGSTPIVAAVQWLQGTMLGSVATTVAVVSVASVGFMMLAGRLEVRRGMIVVLGCFIVFGASSIAAGIQAAAQGGAARGGPYRYEPPAASPLADAIENFQRSPSNPTRDPYAGAGVPRR